MSVVALHRLVAPQPALGRIALSPLLWCVAASCLLALPVVVGDGPSLADWLGDTDDAVRLVSVRELLAGAPWLDTTLPRIGAPEALVSHWSRLIDAPLALTIAALSPLVGTAQAELAARVLWPSLLLVVMQLVMVREGQRRGGLWAAAFVLALGLTSVTATFQFRPGRIDHHNAQILCAVAGLLLLVRSLDDRRLGWAAGALLGLGLAVGYEAIALVLPALGLAAVLGLWQGRDGAGVARAATAACAVMLVALAITTPPARWLAVHCDALSLNLPLFGLCGAAGLWAATGGSFGRWWRLAILAAAGAVGLGLFAALEPACMAGPFGQVNPALRSIWLEHVLETKSIVWFTTNHPALGLAFAAFTLAGAAAQVALWRRQPHAATSLATAIVVLGVALGFWQIKLMPYASWLAALPLALYVAQLPAWREVSAPLMRCAAVVVLNQATLSVGFDAAVSSAHWLGGTTPAQAQEADVGPACTKLANLAPLGALPAGLVASDIDMAPHIVAASAHRVVAAPYHRLDQGILANAAILGGMPGEAMDRIKALGVDYLALCAEEPKDAKPRRTRKPGGLAQRLLAHERVPGLQELTAGEQAPVRLWRVLAR
jgi:hypothetical protein